ncbi:MAG: CDGSH iron-sulfur domain-containing protein [Bacteroidales bacterium]|nr:CDGSH iron-sulfur domain-containing protein [Bacteroidales bacterium]
MHPKKTAAEFTFKPGASLRIKGNFILKDFNGNVIETPDEIKLCRCGKSGNMPFCDHSHRSL